MSGAGTPLYVIMPLSIVGLRSRKHPASPLSAAASAAFMVGRGAFAPLLYDAFAVERLFYMACGSRTYVESDKLSLSTYVRRGMENKSLEIGWWLYAQDGSGPA